MHTHHFNTYITFILNIHLQLTPFINPPYTSAYSHILGDTLQHTPLTKGTAV